MKIIKSTDLNRIFPVVANAFGNNEEACLVRDLLSDESAQPILSLVALDDDEYVGHILFTRCTVDGLESEPSIYLLAPLAVLPKYQKQGIGGLLIKEGLRLLREMLVELVFVLGHMDYYPRYGFVPDAKKYGYSAPYPIPEEFKNAWMIHSLTDGDFSVEKAQIRCSDMLNKKEYWEE